ncbi:hypothetical protein ACMU_18720 [Actibacterium mucosum KCTC 23349]|uniref:Thiamine biosynthesis protein ThiS n=1 Tax=Actibacterium mucosum KCTC 23349 TaxID=1454373 RepID=A0A037ZHH4_9RHOB|nr:sulfur carrier protein ThiS [Actibacterium mucosum]KAJ54260.1 hypothetical protein ACMU_18720 [Actibacterium mucosum KCTC 23349]
MKINVNGTARDVTGPSLNDVLVELGHGVGRVATAVNETFVPAAARAEYLLQDGDRVEIVAPRQGG